MRRFVTLFGAVLIGSVLVPSLASAQVIVQARSYAPPVVVSPSYSYYAPSYYYAPTPYSAGYLPTYSYYPSTTVYSYPAPVVSYSAPVMTYSAPAAIVTPAPGLYEVHTYRGYGIFRPRGYYNEIYYRP